MRVRIAARLTRGREICTHCSTIAARLAQGREIAVQLAQGREITVCTQILNQAKQASADEIDPKMPD
eukprot:1803495-Rhodomonas_salina.3